MTTEPRNLTLERVNRLTIAVADLMESHTAQGRQFVAMMQRMTEHLERIEKSIGELANEQVLLGNRVENAFNRSLRANIRLDEIEDAASPESAP